MELENILTEVNKTNISGSYACIDLNMKSFDLYLRVSIAFMKLERDGEVEHRYYEGDSRDNGRFKQGEVREGRTKKGVDRRVNDTRMLEVNTGKCAVEPHY